MGRSPVRFPVARALVAQVDAPRPSGCGRGSRPGLVLRPAAGRCGRATRFTGQVSVGGRRLGRQRSGVRARGGVVSRPGASSPARAARAPPSLRAAARGRVSRASPSAPGSGPRGRAPEPPHADRALLVAFGSVLPRGGRRSFLVRPTTLLHGHRELVRRRSTCQGRRPPAPAVRKFGLPANQVIGDPELARVRGSDRVCAPYARHPSRCCVAGFGKLPKPRTRSTGIRQKVLGEG
jgi:hypothetical protein